MKDQNIELPPLPAYFDDFMDRTKAEIQEHARAAIEHFLNQSGQYVTNDATRQAAIDEAIEADRQRTGDNKTGRNDATQDALNKVAEVFCMDPDELDDPYTVVSAAKDFFANWELDRKNWDRQRRGEPVAKVRDRGFEVVDGKHVPTVLVEFPVDDWESRDRFAAALDTPQPAEHNIDYKQLYEQMCNRCDSLDAKLAEYERSDGLVLCVSSDAFKRLKAGDDYVKAFLPPLTKSEDMALYGAAQPSEPSGASALHKQGSGAQNEHQAPQSVGPTTWQPIETAPKDNKRLLYLARLDEHGGLVELDFDGSWEYREESWELSHINGYCWESNGGIEEPTHWAYQDEPLPMRVPSDELVANIKKALVARALDCQDDAELMADAKCIADHVTPLLARYGQHAQPAEPVAVPRDVDDLAHEIWAAAQLVPGEGIEDGADRIAALLARHDQPARSASPVTAPSDDEIVELRTAYDWRTPQGNIRFARALLARYRGQPAASAEQAELTWGVIRDHLGSEMADALCVTRWKDGIDIQEPVAGLKQLIAAFAAPVAAQPSVPRWIPVEERLPDIIEHSPGSIAGTSDYVLVLLKGEADDRIGGGDIDVWRFFRGGRGDLTSTFWDYDNPKVTHWMTLPTLPADGQPPKEPL